MKKTLIIILIVSIVFSLASLCSCGGSENAGPSTTKGASDTAAQSGGSETNSSAGSPSYAKNGEMKLRIFKIGKDDAALMRTSSKTVLFDAGQDVKDAEEIVSYLAEKNITKIDYLIITRFDSGNIGGIPTLLEGVSVGKVIEPSYDKDSEAYTAYTAALSAKGLTPEKLTEDRTIEVDDVTLKLYKSNLTSYTEDKDSALCMAVSIVHGNNNFLLCGGASSERVGDILNMGDISHDFILMPDHGVFETNTEALIQAVSPDYAAIIDSTKHPADQATLVALASLDVDYYRTSNGNIKVTSDKSKIKIEQGSSSEE